MVLKPDETSDLRSIPQLWIESYGELRKMARGRLRMSGPLTLLDTTDLVNQSYIRLIESGKMHLETTERRQFFSYAAEVMRSVIVDIARQRQASKRGSGKSLRLDTKTLESVAQDEDPLRVDELLESLRYAEPRLASVVEMRFFGGYSEAEIAEILNLNERTVRRDWEKARLLLRLMLK